MYFSEGSTDLRQTFRVYTRVFTQHTLQVSLKQLLWFNTTLNLKVYFFKWTCSCALDRPLFTNNESHFAPNFAPACIWHFKRFSDEFQLPSQCFKKFKRLLLRWTRSTRQHRDLFDLFCGTCTADFGIPLLHTHHVTAESVSSTESKSTVRCTSSNLYPYSLLLLL